jgi:hypothetical protein
MRQKDKIEKYLDKLIKKHNGTLQESEKSRYYSVRGRILRVSDHVGKSSDGCISIIFDSSDQGHYIIHGHSSGNISVLNYEQAKEFVRSFVRTSFLFKELSGVIPTTARAEKIITPEKEQEILVKVLKENFSTKQLHQIKAFLSTNPKDSCKQLLHKI